MLTSICSSFVSDIISYCCKECSYVCKRRSYLSEHYLSVHGITASREQLKPLTQNVQLSREFPVKTENAMYEADYGSVATAAAAGSATRHFIITAAATNEQQQMQQQSEQESQMLYAQQEQQLQQQLQQQQHQSDFEQQHILQQQTHDDLLMLDRQLGIVLPNNEMSYKTIADNNMLTTQLHEIAANESNGDGGDGGVSLLVNDLNAANEMCVGNEFIVMADGSVEEVMGNGK